MPASEGTEPVGDDELLYRRIPASENWYDPAGERPLAPEAFHPNKDRDRKGISVWRSKYKTEEQAASGRPGRSYYIAVLRADRLREARITAIPDVDDGGPGHCVLPQLNSAARRSPETAELKRLLAEHLVERIEGPFHTPL